MAWINKKGFGYVLEFINGFTWSQNIFWNAPYYCLLRCKAVLMRYLQQTPMQVFAAFWWLMIPMHAKGVDASHNHGSCQQSQLLDSGV